MPPRSNPEIQWILDGLARNRTKTRSGVAKAMGIHKSGVTKLLKGERQLKLREGFRIAAYLGVAAPTGFSEEDTAFDHSDATVRSAPIFRASEDPSREFWRLHRDEAPIDRKPKAPSFASAAHVFGFYAPDGSMAPRFKAGELIFVDPTRPAAPGDDALFMAKRSPGAVERVVAGELVAATPTHFVFAQYARPGEQRLPVKSWTASLILLRGH